MGFLNFLNRRSSKPRSVRSFSLQNGRSILTASVSSLRSSDVHSIVSNDTAALVRSSAHGHVDLLDAHGGIRPCDFRSRVQAAGVRDYGEDVAERNLGENGVDVQSAAAREFYERKIRRLAQTSSIASRREADQPQSTTTFGGSEVGDMSYCDDGLKAKRPFSTLSLEPRLEAGGVAGRPFVSSVAPTLQRPRSVQVASIDYQSRSTRSRESPSVNKHWASTERLVSDTDPANKRQSRQSSRSRSQSRSISPPCVPRYRHRRSMTTMPEEENAHMTSSLTGDNRRRRTASTIGVSTPGGGEACSVSPREDFRSPSLERLCLSDSESESEFGVLPAVHVRAAKPRLVAVAPPPHHAQWQDAVRLAVEEILAQLPLTVDLKALLDLSQNSETLNEDIVQRVPIMRRSSLRQGSRTCSSTPTTDLSDYASSNTGRSSSRNTTTTSIDSSARIDAFPRTGHGSILDGRSSAGDDYQFSPTAIAAVDEDPKPDAAKCRNGKYRHPGVAEMQDLERLTSDYSDVDSFTEPRPQTPNDDQGPLLHDDGFGDLSANLPGLVTDESPKPCVICNVLASLQGTSGPSRPCEHNGVLSQKQRLRALGYDYDSDESDTPTAKPTPAKQSRTKKKLTSGIGGGLRRLKLVDDRIEEASEEASEGECLGTSDSQFQHGVRRKPRFIGLPKSPLPSIVVHEDGGNIADME
ncbi:hypothetical protein C2857_006783 [Epichloe festucae Fl1]|uniref:Uncharacterized protein n=1 Tax=Epichloe festucae (strain Fl1) TaxID=877507 RepID=A0A7S9PUI5_EPIFF|nr:hypothetical protein C2857_006783 [Epichloe festucae Fl1]